MSVKFYKVGGTVRDHILGVKAKDIDYAVEGPSFAAMVDAIKARGGEIFLERPEFFTIRAKLPEIGAADFTLCRKEGFYSDGRHPDSVEVGTIYDDLARRDFTCNAIAIEEGGGFINPHNGVAHAIARELHCVGNANDRFDEDPLRLLRAIRFHVTKKFHMSIDIKQSFHNPELLNKLVRSVAKERTYEELRKCFEFDTLKTLQVFEEYRMLRNMVFGAEYGLGLLPFVVTSKK